MASQGMPATERTTRWSQTQPLPSRRRWRWQKTGPAEGCGFAPDHAIHQTHTKAISSISPSISRHLNAAMFEQHTPPSMPITGFALYPDRLILQGGNPSRCCLCQPDQLSPDAYKQFLWLLEQALGAKRNDLAQTDPSTIHSLLRVIVLCHKNWRPHLFQQAVLAHAMQSSPPPALSHAQPAQPSRGGLREPVAGLIPPVAVHPRALVAGVDDLGLLPKAGRPQVA